MLRTAVLAAPALALAVSAVASAAPSTTVEATVVDRPHGEALALTQQGGSAGRLKLRACVDTSATAVTCSGEGTVLGLTGTVRLRWHCPVDRACQGHGEGTLKNNGATLALLHVKAGVVELESTGARFRIGVEVVGE